MTNADFLNSAFPAPVEMPALDPAGPHRFCNRELSWLGFNWRVLEEADNPNVPLLERLRFLSISATNLDEFYTVRVAGLRELEREGVTTPAADGLTPTEQLKLIHADARALMAHQQDTFNRLAQEMQAEGITICTRAELSAQDRSHLDHAFLHQIFPVLSPLAIDPAHPFPFIPNTGFSLALQLERKADKRKLQALLPIPHQTSCRWKTCCWNSSARCSPAMWRKATAPSASCATVIWRSRRRPKTWCANSKPP